MRPGMIPNRVMGRLKYIKFTKFLLEIKRWAVIYSQEAEKFIEIPVGGLEFNFP